MLRKFSTAFGDSRQERFWFALCSLIALVAVWGHRYPVGIDLPQHANLFRLWTELSASGPWEYRRLYRIELFTPYLLPYVVAFPLTKAFGALAAVKLLYTFSALGTPLLMRRWLRTIGADPRYGLVGFVVAFDFPYIWGFFSNVVALPLVFAYLAAFESQGERPRWRQIGLTSLFGLMLFFSHGITFGVATGAAGISYLLRGRWFSRLRALLHTLPLVAAAAIWLIVRHKQTSSHPIQDFLSFDRIITLFSGTFLPYPDQRYAIVAIVAVACFLLIARPRLRFGAARGAPFALALIGFLALPEWIASTWLVASRLCVFVHAFAPALLVPRESDRVARQWLHVLGALTVAFLVLLNVRLRAFNQELAGMDAIAGSIPAGADLQTVVPETDSTSEVFGPGQLGQVPAWISAERGGMVDNDSAAAIYFQIPIKRNPVPFPTGFRYVIGHGEERRYRGHMRSWTGSSKPLASDGEWLLYRRRGIETDDLEVLRNAQGYGQLQQDRSIGAPSLTIAGQRYAQGLGAHADSFIRIRLKRPGSHFSGACGVDASAGSGGQVIFRIRDSAGAVLFESPLLRGGMPAVPFSVPVTGMTELVLEAEAPFGIASAHADWVDLSLR